MHADYATAAGQACSRPAHGREAAAAVVVASRRGSGDRVGSASAEGWAVPDLVAARARASG